MRVAFYLFFAGSGIGRYTHELLNTLSRSSNISTELICLPSFHWRSEAHYAIWPGLYEIAHRNPLKRKSRFLTAQIANPKRLAQRAFETRSNIIHLSNINHLTFPLWKKTLRRFGSKVVATVHDVRREKGIINHRYELNQLQRFYRWADALFVHSKAQADDLKSFADVNPAQIHIVPHGPYDYGATSNSTEELRRRYRLPITKQIALFFGNIRDEKNLRLLLQALTHHRETTHLLVAGRIGGQLTLSDYRQISKDHGINENVTFLNRYVDDKEIPDLFTVCDWVALPYSRRFTSQSGVLNVAMQYHRPVLISNAPTFSESLSACDVGVQINADDLDSLNDGLARIVARVETKSDYQFEKYLSSFSWQRNATITRQVYDSLIDS